MPSRKMKGADIVERGGSDKQRHEGPVPPAVEEQRGQCEPGGCRRMAPARDAEKDQRRDREEPEDEFDRIENKLQLARVEPAFEHRDDPDHDAEVRCVSGVMLATQALDMAGPQVPASRDWFAA